MDETEAIVRVLTHICKEMVGFCRDRDMTTEQTLRIVKEVLSNETARTWAAMQVIALTDEH